LAKKDVIGTTVASKGEGSSVPADDKPSRDEILFVQLVSMFQIAAMQQMGKIRNPVTNKIERDLDQARVSIDILGMIKEKTKGNLRHEEQEYLDKLLFETRMNYLEELKRPDETAGAGKTEEGAPAGESGGAATRPENSEGGGEDKTVG
jgi:hypothetical protein